MTIATIFSALAVGSVALEQPLAAALFGALAFYLVGHGV